MKIELVNEQLNSKNVPNTGVKEIKLIKQLLYLLKNKNTEASNTWFKKYRTCATYFLSLLKSNLIQDLFYLIDLL